MSKVLPAPTKTSPFPIAGATKLVYPARSPCYSSTFRSVASYARKVPFVEFLSSGAVMIHAMPFLVPLLESVMNFREGVW
jgi:hypothetical protein